MATNENASNGMALGVVVDDEEAQVVEEAEEEHATAPHRSRRNIDNNSPRYVELVLLYVSQLVLLFELFLLLTLCVQRMSQSEEVQAN